MKEFRETLFLFLPHPKKRIDFKCFEEGSRRIGSNASKLLECEGSEKETLTPTRKVLVISEIFEIFLHFAFID